METEIEHSDKKRKSTVTLVERVEKDQKRQADSVATLKAGGAEIKKKMDEARGESLRRASLIPSKAARQESGCGARSH